MQPIKIVVSADTGTAESAIERVRKSTQRLDNQIKQAGAGMNQYGATVSRSSTNLNRWAKGALQQAGYQVGDFAVQVANGTSKMQAFGQQGSQLLGIFGPFGAVLGAGVAIVSAISVAWQKSAEAARNAAGGVDTLSEALKELDSLGKISASTIDDYLTVAFRESAAAVLELVMTLREARFEALMGSVASSVSDVTAELNRTEDAWEAVQAVAIVSQREFLEFAKTAEAVDGSTLALIGNAGLLTSEINQLQYAMDQIATSTGMNDFVANLVEAKELAESIGGPLADQIVESLIDMAQEAGVLDAVLASAEEHAKGMAKSLGDGFVRTSTIIQEDILMGMPVTAAPLPPSLRASRKAAESAAAKLAKEYDRLRAAIDPAWKAQDEFNKAVSVLDRALAAGLIPDMAVYNELLDQLRDKYKGVSQVIQSVADSIQSSFESAFMSIIDGTQSAKEAFRSMALAVIKELYKILVVQQLVGSFNAASGSGTGLVGLIMRGISGFLATGGTATGGKAYMVGERGPELFIPGRTGQVVPNGQGVGSGITINQTINLSTGVSETVRAEVVGMMPQIVNNTKNAVIDGVRRGGAYGKAFG